MKNALNFVIQEFVPPEIYNIFGDTLSQRYINPTIVQIAQYIRNRTKKVIINDWHRMGSRTQSARRISTHSYFSDTSDHSSGNAIDCLTPFVNTRELYYDILHNSKKWYEVGLRAIECNTWNDRGEGWLHVSCAEYGNKEGHLIIIDAHKPTGKQIINPEIINTNIY